MLVRMKSGRSALEASRVRKGCEVGRGWIGWEKRGGSWF